MITYNNLYDKISSFENLYAAAMLARKGKRYEDIVGKFFTNLESELFQLSRELYGQTYRPGSYKTKIITRPKVRMISAAPFRDRVVHHALCRVVMPLFEKKMIFDMHSNRMGKGTHSAIRRAQKFSRRYRFVLKADIRKYFPSMDHEILKAAFRKTISCQNTLWLMDLIVSASNPQETVYTWFPGDDLAQAGMRRVGLPIGNLTSQWFSSIYLSTFDHWVKQQLKCSGYVRYVDDFLLYGNDKRQLANWRTRIHERLNGYYRLRLNERKTRTFRTSDGITFLGQRIWSDHRRLARENVIVARKRLLWNVRQYSKGRLSEDELRQRWHSWRGHASQADANGIIEQIRVQLYYAYGATG